LEFAAQAAHEKGTSEADSATVFAINLLGTPVEDDDLVSQVKGFLLVVGDQDAGDAHLVYDGLQPLAHRFSDLHTPTYRTKSPLDISIYRLTKMSSFQPAPQKYVLLNLTVREAVSWH
jgi:hypothetical protein